MIARLLLMEQYFVTLKVKIYKKELFYPENELDRRSKTAYEKLDACKENLT